MNRRDVLKSAGIATAAAVTGPFFHIRPARADKGELVVVSWGGAYDDALREFVFPSFEKATGYTVKLDAPPETAKVKAMVQSGNVSWDVLMTDAPAIQALLKDNLLEQIDYTAVDKAKLAHVPKELQQPFALGQRIYSFNIVYNTNLMPKSKHARNWAEVWDAKNFPGGRTFNFQGGIAPQLEAALLADGVPMDKLYPLDTKRALGVLKKIRKDAVYWNSGSESEQLMRTGEASIGLIWNTRAKVLHEETKGRITWTWNQGVLQAGIFVIPKGNPGGVLAQQLMASACANEDGQVELLKFLGNGPTNPRSAPKVPAEFRRFNPTDPDNAKVQFVYDGNWWSANYTELNQQYLDTAAG